MASLLHRYPTFRHGVHPPESKLDTCNEKIRQFPFAPVLVIPLAQHVGAPAVAVVREGQDIERGQLLARADGFVSVPQHAPASGVVRRIGLVPGIAGKMIAGIYLEPHPGSSQEVAEGEPCDLESSSADEIASAIPRVRSVPTSIIGPA